VSARPSALGLAASLRAGERGVGEVLAETLAHIEQRRELGCFLSVEREWAQRRAAELERARGGGEPLGPLFGVPLALKANMCLTGWAASCGSRILASYRAPYTATFVQRLLDAGALPVGTTNMDEFAMGSSGENSAFGPARNPWDERRTPGGSSSGSAAAVAAGLVPLALGSDTGGSVRLPAAMCGLSGFKPTYGRVSRFGLVAFGSSLDQVAPLARNVAELAAVMALLSGADPLDSTCLDLPPIEVPATPESLGGLVVGVPQEYLPPELDGAVRAAVEAALARLADLGAEIRPVRLPHTEVAIPTYYVVAMAEASSNLARYDGVRYGARAPGDGTLQGMYAATRAGHFGPEVVRRILLGTYVL
jgi:aspartyl-tRNA(Asn)/glutamyl-tRNA(Gln) amidotransferase subunit A